MEITLYVNHSELQTINKTIDNALVLTGSLRSESSIIDPSIIVQTTNPSGYNYAYIPEFGRYYFITDITSVRTNLWRLDMTVDVLMTFKDQILAMDVIVSDGEVDDERYVSGGQWFTNVKHKTDIVNFPNGLLENGEYILITAGGAITVGS